MAALLVAAGLCLPGPARAAVSCSLSLVGVAFGVYSPLGVTPTYANGQLLATCTLLSGGSTTVSLTSSFSAGAGGSFAPRRMLSGSNFLAYNLYFDAAYSQVRGDGTGGSQTGGATLTLTPSNPTQSANGILYGRIPAGQDVAAGSYADTIVVTVTY